MFGTKTEATVNGQGNIIIQNSSGVTITLDPNNSEELRMFLMNFNEKLSELPFSIVELLTQKSQSMQDKTEKGANLYLSSYLMVSSGIKPRDICIGTTITNLTREIRYFNQPSFKIYPPFENTGYDEFFLTTGNNSQQYPCRLEFGQPHSSNFPLLEGTLKLFKSLYEKQSDAFIQAFVTTTIGEIYSSNKHPISTLMAICNELKLI